MRFVSVQVASGNGNIIRGITRGMLSHLHLTMPVPDSAMADRRDTPSTARLRLPASTAVGSAAVHKKVHTTKLSKEYCVKYYNPMLVSLPRALICQFWCLLLNEANNVFEPIGIFITFLLFRLEHNVGAHI